MLYNLTYVESKKFQLRDRQKILVIVRSGEWEVQKSGKSGQTSKFPVVDK